MLGLTLSLCLLTADLRVEGLASGERATVLAPALGEAPRSDLERHVEGRVIDGHSGRPVGGALVECWTEEISRMGRGFRSVGESISAEDGCFRLRVRDGGLEGDKVRVRKPGYLTRACTLDDLELLLLVPAPAWTPRLVLLDLQDRPLAGVRVTSTYSCSHDHPAFERESDALGRVELAEYGLQEAIGELRLRAPGMRAIASLDEDEVLAGRGEATRIRLARGAAIAGRILDEHGLPLAGAALHVVDGEGYHVPFTDAQGRFEITSRYGGDGVRIEVLREDQNTFVHYGRLPSARAMNLRLAAHEPAQDVPRGTLRIDVPQDVPLELFHEQGWRATPRGSQPQREVELPAGCAWLLVGGAFSGWEEELIELSIPAGGVETLVLAPRKEPTLTLLWPEGEAETAIVEAGGDSRIRDLNEVGSAHVSVPAGRPITVVTTGARTRRVTLPPLAGDATADLRSRECLLDAEPPAPRRGRIEVRLEQAGGEPCAGELTVRGLGEPEALRSGPASFTVEAPIGAPLVLRAHAAGHAECWVHAQVSTDESEPLVLRPARLAALAIQSPTGAQVEGPLAEHLDALHPGPLTLRVALADGRRVVLELVLEAGAERTLRIHEAPR